MRIEVAHELEVGEVHARLRELAAYWQQKYGFEPLWTRDAADLAGSFMGLRFAARLTIAERLVVVEGPEPGFLLRRRVTEYVVRKLGEYLDPQTPLEALADRRGRLDESAGG